MEQRFWAKVKKSEGCWEWTACKSMGYGQIKHGGKMVASHRLSYEMAYGKFPKELHVLHTCDNPGCVKPEHLWLGTHKENQKDKTEKGRHHSQLKTHCSNGHEYSGINSRGHRVCKECNSAACRRYREARSS